MLCRPGHRGSDSSQRGSASKCSALWRWKKLGWKHTQQRSTEASKLELWLTDVHCPTAVVEATVRSRLQKDRELRHSSAETEWNMRSHLKPRGPQLLQPRALPSACEETSSQLKMGVGGVGCWGRWLIWISSFLSFVYVVILSSSAMLTVNKDRPKQSDQMQGAKLDTLHGKFHLSKHCVFYSFRFGDLCPPVVMSDWIISESAFLSQLHP